MVTLKDPDGASWEISRDPLGTANEGMQAGPPRVYFRILEHGHPFSEWWSWEGRRLTPLKISIEGGDLRALVTNGRPRQRFVGASSHQKEVERLANSFAVEADIDIELGTAHPEALAHIYRHEVEAEEQAKANQLAVLDAIMGQDGRVSA